MWLQGEEREMMLLGFEIYWEGEESGIPEKIAEKYHDTVDRLIAKEDPDKVERALKEIIEAAPDFAPAYNQLALVYERQGRVAEAQVLVAETHARFPDYFFSRAILARYYVRDERLEEARVLLDGLMQEERLHISEFRVLARAQMDYSLALGETDSAILAGDVARD